MSSSFESQPMLPDNRCCYFLTLRKGSAIIALVDIAVNVVVFGFYVSSWLDSSGETTNLDIGFFVVFGLQLVCNLLLVFAAVKKSPAFTVPWLTMNVGLIAIFLVLITLLLFFGSIQTPLTTDQYTSFLSTLGFLGAVLLFCWLIVFQFRKNLIEEKRILSTFIPSAPNLDDEMPQNYRRPPSPPPSYDEVAKVSLGDDERHNLKKTGYDQPQQLTNKPKSGGGVGDEKKADELPPEYSAAVAMTPNFQQLYTTNISPVL